MLISETSELIPIVNRKTHQTTKDGQLSDDFEDLQSGLKRIRKIFARTIKVDIKIKPNERY